MDEEENHREGQNATLMQSALFRRGSEFKKLVCTLQQGKNMSIASDGSNLKPHDNLSVALSFIASLKTCAKGKDLQRGSNIHADIVKSRLLESNIYVGNTLISMYAKCGALEKAQQVFDQLPLRNTVSWNALMVGYAQNGHGHTALAYFEQMQWAGFTPDAFTFVCILKACGSIRALDKGKEIHSLIVSKYRLDADTLVANALIEMYAHCGAFDKAVEVFDELPFRSVVTWTALITGYLQHGRFKEALSCFKKMQHGGLLPDAVTLACILKACSCIGALDEGQEIHSLIVREHVLGKDILVSNALVDMYAKCGALEKAQAVFDELSSWDVVSWNALITGYAQHAHGDEALNCFKKMQQLGYFPDEVTFTCILKACGSIGALDKGQEIHVQVVREGWLKKHVVIANALLDMYVKCGAIEKAREVFGELPLRDMVSWNSLISGYVQHGWGKEALVCFSQMQGAGFSPDAVTFTCVLSACGSMKALDKGKEIHAQLLKEQALNMHVMAAYALVDMYVKCGALENAREVFEELPIRNLVVWTALIAGYAENKQGDEAFTCFEQLQLEGFYPDAFTFSCILKACGSIGATEKGRKLHTKLVLQGSLEMDKVIGIALLDMYASFGMIAEAQDLFDKLPAQDVVAWSALMVGYAQLGRSDVVLNLFDKMTRQGMEPDTVTFTIVLNTCSRRGLLSKGQTYFEIISRSFGFMPTLRHCNCMVDLFGRAGHLDKAVALLSRSLSSNFITWHAILTACRKLENSKLGTWAFENALQLSKKDWLQKRQRPDFC